MIALLIAAQAGATLDSFDAAGAWKAQGSDGVTAIASARGGALRLAYDFGKVSGYAFVARALAIDWAADYEVTLRVRGTGGVNDLQLKFTDAGGANVWWYQRRNFRPSSDWQTLRIRTRDIEFAWGPTADKNLRHSDRVELVVVHGRDGAAGYIEIDDLRYAALPPQAPLPPPRASDPRAIDRDPRTAWVGKGGEDWRLDFGGRKAIGGVTLRWEGPAPRYVVETSDDGRLWTEVRAVDVGDGGNDPIALSDLETRWLRISLPPGAKPARLAEVVVELPEWGATSNAFVTALAKSAPRGSFPRGFTEQSYWTLVGPDGGPTSGLIGEDGAIEVAKGGFSIEPFVEVAGKRYGWADVTPVQSLEDRSLPMPHVSWRADGWSLDTSLFADSDAPRLMARWRVTNTAATRRTLRLVLGVRPFQVNPPAQFLSQVGGISPISRIAWTGSALAVTTPPAIEGDAAVIRLLQPLAKPDAIGMRPFDRGALAEPALLEPATSMDDPTGLGSAALAWAFDLAPGEHRDVEIAIPFEAGVKPPDAAGFARAHDATAAFWRARLGGVTMTVPPAKQAVADTLRTALAHVLMSRDGPALKPGTRSYDRSWIRDGAMMSDTLLRLGVTAPARDFADWYGGFLFDNGKVPCCVDARGADPVPENDSHGEYIHLVTQLYRYTGDRAALARDWPRLEAARRYMEGLRQSERTPQNIAPAMRMRYGLMPPSISHEGYSAQAQYSLWDDFWALTGYKDAALAARILGSPEAAAIARQRDEFATDVHAAITASVKHFGIDFIPGATSLGDFDATSTTMALDPAGEQARLDSRLLANTFERQWQRVTARAQPGTDWADYTPYELRNVSAFVRLGWRTRANALLDAYMADRRPAAWNGWAEVVGRKPREIRFIGDMPHAWVASDFIRAALDLFAYERDGAIVLGGGIDEGWLTGAGVSIVGLRTSAGTVDFTLRRDAGGIVATIGGTARPPDGFVLPWPLEGKPGVATVDGKAAKVEPDGLHLSAAGRPMTVRWSSAGNSEQSRAN
ncbi:discoidin domain-containing protein [Sphingomonas sp. Tas61C01]|uniref:discoidin domain-containing protein n=1 Tax=Sphingomonas sp. Tas61C01 TaxID=3458297 RepID=UPI00403E7269